MVFGVLVSADCCGELTRFMWGMVHVFLDLSAVCKLPMILLLLLWLQRC